MRFTIKQTGCGSERVGCLTEFVRSSGANIETPTSALHTQAGSVVHLTADVLLRVFPNPQVLWVPLSSAIQLEPGVKAQGEGVAKFAGLQGQVTCVALHNNLESTPPGHFEVDKVPLWAKHGKKLINADRYMDIIEVFKPDLVLALADSRTSLGEPSKRIIKSVDRTNNMLDVCVKRYKSSKLLQDSSLLGVVVGAGQDKKLNDSIQHLLKYKEDLCGVALAGITDGTDDSYKVPIDELESIFKNVNESLPKHLLRIVEGCWSPVVVLAAIEQGFDMFDGSYPLKLTNAGHALALNFDTNRNCEELCILHLNEERYKDEFKPILEGCECLACKKHTRAYIRHLLNTREMLSSVLLSIHNLHHYDQMFHHARRHIASKTFQIYKQHVTTQYELYKSSETLNGKEEIVNESQTVNSINKEDSNSSNIKKKIKTSTYNGNNCDIDVVVSQ